MVLAIFLLITAEAALAQAVDETEELPSTAEPLTEAKTTTETPPTPVPFFSRGARNNQLLATSLPEEALWLNTDQDPALALFRPIETAEAKGIVLFLHATDTPPEWPVAFENARRNLPRHGWATLALALPPRTPPAPALRDPVIEGVDTEVSETEISESEGIEPGVDPDSATETTGEQPLGAAEQEAPAGTSEPADNASDPGGTADVAQAAAAATETALSRADIIYGRLAAAYDWIAQSTYNPVMVVVDNSSVMAVSAHLQSLSPDTVAALILVNLQAQEALTTAELDKLFAELSLPVLDVFPTPEHSAMTPVRKRHRGAALRNGLSVYQQVLLPPQQTVTLEDDKNFWVERLRGFMERQK